MKKFTLQHSVYLTEFVLFLLIGIQPVSTAQEVPWNNKENMPTARGFLSGTIVDGKIYIVGGVVDAQTLASSALLEMYDPETDSWSALDSMPEGRSCHAACTYNGKIYVFGGTYPTLSYNLKKSVFVYDPVTDSWTTKADMPHAVAGCAIAVLNDTIYLIGGGGVYFPEVSRVMAYHPPTDTWIEKKSLDEPRGFLSACVFGEKIYVFGGTTIDYTSVAYQLVEVYDPATNTWTRKADMPTGRLGTGVCTAGGYIYAIGGWRFQDVMNINQMYDPVNDEWKSKEPMKQKRFLHFLGSVEDKIYCIGGAYPVGGEAILLSSVEEYDPGLDIPTTLENTIENASACFRLAQNSPNPFQSITLIKYDLKMNADVRISLFNILGHEERILINKKQLAGTYEVTFDSEGLTDGIYYYRMETKSESGNTYSETRKVLLLK
jgi:N-acetylneuraminic acid mutarotase